MTERNTSGERLSERDVDRLLQRFFHDELPVEFRRDETSVTLARTQLEPIVRTTTSDSSRNLAGLLGILVSATCCLVVMMFIPGTPAPHDGGDPSVPAMAAENDRQHETGTEGNSLPIEEQNPLKFTTMGNHETDPGLESEKTGPLEPELEIEIFPLRPDKPRE